MLEIMKNIHYYMFILYNALSSCRMFSSLVKLFLIDKDINLMDVGYFKYLIKFFILSHTCISFTEVVKIKSKKEKPLLAKSQTISSSQKVYLYS